MENRWLRIGGTLMAGLFVSYLDRTNLSVTIKDIANSLSFSGNDFSSISSIVLTTFLIGYIIANILGGIVTTRYDPKKIAIFMVALWSVVTFITGFSTGIVLLVCCRFILGLAEGIYWPQQSRFVKLWFSPRELTRANSMIQYYGQFLALALGFIILTPLHQWLGWRSLFFICGAIGLLVIVPLYCKALYKTSDAPYPQAVDKDNKTEKLNLNSFGGTSFILVIFTYLTQGMLFWGITLWIPMAVESIGFKGMSGAVASSLPYLCAVVFAIPMSWVSDKTGKRIQIASIGLVIPGILLTILPSITNGYIRLFLISIAMGYYASSFTPNIWSIIQTYVNPRAVGAASGIVNGIGAGGGGTIAGFLVAFLYGRTGSYMYGFMTLGIMVILGGCSLYLYGVIKHHSVQQKMIISHQH